MSRVCVITWKKTAVGNTRSHSMRAVKRKFYPNLFYKNIMFIKAHKLWAFFYYITLESRQNILCEIMGII